MITCTRRFQFCAGHRVMGHESKCAHMHGHNYVAYVTCQMDSDEDEVDKLGRVVDFSVIKDVIGGWIDTNWDHGFILNDLDAAALNCLQLFSNLVQKMPQNTVNRQKLFTMPMNPTAENLAMTLAITANQLLAPAVKVLKVVMEETENCSATYEMPEVE